MGNPSLLTIQCTLHTAYRRATRRLLHTTHCLPPRYKAPTAHYTLLTAPLQDAYCTLHTAYRRALQGAYCTLHTFYCRAVKHLLHTTLCLPPRCKALESLLDCSDSEDNEGHTAMLSQLSEQACVWAGGQFVAPANTALHSPLNLAPHLYTVPADFHCFGRLLHKLGVRDEFEGSQYIGTSHRPPNKYIST